PPAATSCSTAPCCPLLFSPSAFSEEQRRRQGRQRRLLGQRLEEALFWYAWLDPAPFEINESNYRFCARRVSIQLNCGYCEPPKSGILRSRQLTRGGKTSCCTTETRVVRKNRTLQKCP